MIVYLSYVIFPVFSPLPAKPKGTISLPSVCPSVCLSFRFQFSGLFSAVDEDIQLKFDMLLISMSYRSSLSFFTLDQLLTELFPLMFTFSFPDFFLTGWSEESEIFYMASSWIVIYQVRVSVDLTFLWLNYGPL
jgi:hypothetical protein